MDDDGFAARDHVCRERTCPHAKQRVRRASVDHRRPSPASERKGAVGHEAKRDVRVNCVSGRSLMRSTRNDRDTHIATGKVPREVVNASFESSGAMDREYRAGDDNDR
jgi:hypothetical protein